MKHTDTFNITHFNTNDTIYYADVGENTVMTSLTIPPMDITTHPTWPGLSSGQTYRVKITARDSRGTAVAMVTFTTNSPPRRGIVSVCHTITALHPSRYNHLPPWMIPPRSVPVMDGLMMILHSHID